MKKIIRNLLALKWHTIHSCIYTFNLAQSIPLIEADVPLDLKIEKLSNSTIRAVASENNKVVGKAEIMFNNRLASQLDLAGKPLIGNAITYREYRGKNIQGFILSSLLRYCASNNIGERIYIFTSPDNRSMKRVLQKLHFVYQKKVHVTRWLGLCIKKQFESNAI